MDSPNPAPVPVEAAPDNGVLILTSKGKRARVSSQSVRGHDFRESGIFAANEQRRLKARQELFTRSLAGRLGLFLRFETSLQLANFHNVGAQQFAQQLPPATHITFFRIEPLKGTGLFVIPSRLGLAMVDRLLGGPGKMPETGRELSEIEIGLIDQVAMLVLNEWCASCPEYRDLRPSVIGHETKGRGLPNSSGDNSALVLTIDAAMGENRETMHLAFASSMIESLRQLLPSPPPITTTTTAGPVPWNPQFNDLKVTSRAEWHGLKVSAGELSRLRAGDVLMFAPGSNPQLELRLSNVPKFIGQAGIAGNKWAIQLTNTVNA